MKLSIKWSIIGFFMPIVGIFVGKNVMKRDEALGRSIRRGAALSTIILVLAASFLIYYFALIKK